MEQKKIIKTAMVLDNVVKVIAIIVSVCGILAAVFGGLGLVATAFGSKVEMRAPSISYGALNLELNPEAVDSLFSYAMVVCTGCMLAGIAIFVIGRMSFRAIRALLAPMKEGRPFQSGCCQHIRTLAVLTLAGGIIFQVGNAAMSIFMNRMVDIVSLFAAEAVTGVSVRFSFSLGFLLYAAILFLLSYVFRYGEMLQQESDETL